MSSMPTSTSISISQLLALQISGVLDQGVLDQYPDLAVGVGEAVGDASSQHSAERAGRHAIVAL
jgi:hypothetical protein